MFFRYAKIQSSEQAGEFMAKHTNVILIISSLLFTIGNAGAAKSHKAMHAKIPVEAPPAGPCGAVGTCNGGKQVFLYSCQGDDVIVRLCGDGSDFQTDSKYCVGPERKIKKADFRRFIQSQLANWTLHDNLSPITAADVANSKHKGDLKKAKSCYEEAAKQIEDLQSKLDSLTQALSQTTIADIEGQIRDLRTTKLKPAKEELGRCQDAADAVKKIDKQIQESVDSVCQKKGLFVPPVGTFLHTVLSQYDPSKHPCRSEKECAQEIRVAGQLVGAVISRSINPQGEIEEFLKDTISTNLVLSPRSRTVMSQQKAKAYCAEKKDLGMKWRLPSDQDFLKIFNPGSSWNLNLPSLLPRDPRLWTSEDEMSTFKAVALPVEPKSLLFVRCVSP
jgi:hypothetical protein